MVGCAGLQQHDAIGRVRRCTCCLHQQILDLEITKNPEECDTDGL